MIHIQRRENAKGKWWVNTTVDCMDISFEQEMLGDAENDMMACLFKRGYSKKDVIWEEPTRYKPSVPKEKLPLHSQRLKLDTGMV